MYSVLVRNQEFHYFSCFFCCNSVCNGITCIILDVLFVRRCISHVIYYTVIHEFVIQSNRQTRRKQAIFGFGFGVSKKYIVSLEAYSYGRTI